MVLWNKNPFFLPVYLPRAKNTSLFPLQRLVGPNYFDSHFSVPRKRKPNLCPGDKQPGFRQPAAWEHKGRKESWSTRPKVHGHGKPDTVIIARFKSYYRTINYDRGHLYFLFLLSFGSPRRGLLHYPPSFIKRDFISFASVSFSAASRYRICRLIITLEIDK